jgi:hypothetical protein
MFFGRYYIYICAQYFINIVGNLKKTIHSKKVKNYKYLLFINSYVSYLTLFKNIFTAVLHNVNIFIIT